MLTYTPSALPALQTEKLGDKIWLLIALCLLWLLPGLLGHDPWKPGENQSMAVIMNMLNHGDWLVPQITGMPELEQGPLYFWVAALFVKALAPLGIAAHDAARLSTGVWMALAMWGMGLTASNLYGRRYGRVAVVALLGCLGLLQWGHHVAPAILVLVGLSWLAYAHVIVQRRPLKAGLILAMSWCVLALGVSFAELLLAWLLFLSLWLLSPQKKSFLFAFVIALLLSVPLILIWPLGLEFAEPAVFAGWLRTYVLGVYGGLENFEFLHDFGFLPGMILWFAWPVLPLAAWTLWLNRADMIARPIWRNQLLQMLLVIVYIICAGRPGEAQALALLVPLTLLAAGGVDDLRRGAAQALNWFGAFTFGVITLGFWLAWAALTLDVLPHLQQQLQRFGSGRVPGLGISTLLAVGLTALWILLLMRRHPFGRRAVTNWACGLALTWAIFVGLWQGWLDEGKSYRAMSLAVAQSVKTGCVDVDSIGEAPRAALNYFTRMDLRTGASAKGCRYRLLSWPVIAADSELLWQGGRPNEQKERFFLYFLDEGVSQPPSSAPG